MVLQHDFFPSDVGVLNGKADISICSILRSDITTRVMMIEKYSFGSIILQGKRYTSDLKIINGEVKSNWRRESGHLVVISDIEDILVTEPDFLIIGTGRFGRMKVSKELQQHLAGCNIQLINETTPAAIQAFNQLYLERKNIAAGFHLTC